MATKPPSPQGNPSGGDLSAAELREALVKKARTSRKVSWLLDECIRIPGTNLRFGIDPLLGLFPYGGETVATIIGTLILGEAGKKGMPVKTLVRMGGNMLCNAGIGAIPVVGDLFSFWFKSNSRNYRLLNAYLESEDGSEEPGGWWPVLLIVGTVLAVLVLNLLSWFLFFTLLMKGFEAISGTTL
ncbi:MAG: DUF4112 domain-containing protein [Verrucomicrobiaceae bacterium]|nr:DUF4112 domain-containing protein [Verrucomicrobiaceae bacterium]